MLHKYNEKFAKIWKNVDVGFEKFFISDWVRKVYYILITQRWAAGSYELCL
jgi:hypothetical protein